MDTLAKVQLFQKLTGLSEHRVGMLLAKNGRLIERLKTGRPLLTTTVDAINHNLVQEVAKRDLVVEFAKGLVSGKANQ